MTISLSFSYFFIIVVLHFPIFPVHSYMSTFKEKGRTWGHSFLAQMTRNVETVSIWWRHHDPPSMVYGCALLWFWNCPRQSLPLWIPYEISFLSRMCHLQIWIQTEVMTNNPFVPESIRQASGYIWSQCWRHHSHWWAIDVELISHALNDCTLIFTFRYEG